MADDDVIDVGDPGSFDSGEPQGPWYPRTQRRFRTEQPVQVDKLVIILVQYDWEQNEAGDVRNQTGKYLTEDGWVPFQPYEVFMVDSMPHIDGIDLARQAAVGKRIEELERWIAAMIDFGNAIIGQPEGEPDTPAGETTTDNQGKEQLDNG